MGDDDLVDNEMPVITSSILRPTESITLYPVSGPHRGRICLCVFVGVGVYIYIFLGIFVCIVLREKKSYIARFAVLFRNTDMTVFYLITRFSLFLPLNHNYGRLVN
jgi:hypothetical protein